MDLFSGESIFTVEFLFWEFEFTSPWLFVLINVGLLVLPLVGWLLYQRHIARVETRSVDAGHMVAEHASTIEQYLDELTRHLRFPAGLAGEVRAEIAAHLTDTVAALQADGVSQTRAVATALERLGPSEALAASLREAQQTRGRVFAGIGGGMFAGAMGVPAGLIGGLIAILPAQFVTIIVLALATSMRNTWPGEPGVLGQLVLGELAFDFALAYAARQGVRVASSISRRDPIAIGRKVGVAGALLLLITIVPFTEQQQAWPLIPIQLLAPIAFYLGATWRIDRSWRPSPRLIIRSAVAAGIGAALLSLPFASPSVEHPLDGTAPGIESVAAQAPVRLVPQTSWIEERHGMSAECRANEAGLVDCAFEVTVDDPDDPIGPLDPGWTAFRLEAWRGAPFEGSSRWSEGVAPGVTAPTFTAEVERRAREIRGTVDIGMRRDGPYWWLTLTAMGSDGQRYRLSDGDGVYIEFQGTMLDWLNAAG